MNLFGKRLEELRGHRSKADFARFLGIDSAVNYGRYEAGRVPDPETLCEIANRTGCTIDWLLGRVEEKNKTESVIREPSAKYGEPDALEFLSGVSEEILLKSLAELTALAKTAKGLSLIFLLRATRQIMGELDKRGAGHERDHG